MPRAKVTGAITDRAGYTQLSLARPDGFHYVPGQYVTLAADATDKPKFLALASHASEAALLFVSRNAAPAAGSEMNLSDPMGEGFSCNFSDPQPILFLTHGTGISAVRPAIIERRRLGFTDDTLLYGIRDAASEPRLDCLEQSIGVRQLRAFSGGHRPLARTADGNHWHVQHALADFKTLPFGAVILVGSKEMAAACREVLAGKQFPAEKIFSNY